MSVGDLEGKGMDHEAICDCPFLAHCAAFDDPLIGEDRKGLDGFGCQGQSDVYRNEHCHHFRCAYLVVVLSSAISRPVPSPGEPDS